MLESSKQNKQTNKNYFRFERKRTETQNVSVVFWFASWNQKFSFFRFVSLCFGVSNMYRNNQNKHDWYVTNLNKQKNL